MKVFSNLSLKYKLLIGLSPVLLFAMGFTWYVGSINSHVERSFQSISSSFLELRLISRLEVLNTRLSEATKAFALTNDLKWQEEYDKTSGEFDTLLDEALRLSKFANAEVLRRFEILTNKIKGTELLILSKTRDGQREEAIRLFDTIYSGEQQAASQILTDYLETAGQRVSNDITGTINELGDSERVVSLASLLFIFAIVFFFLFVFGAYVLRPLENLVESALTIESGNRSERAKVFYEDEIGDLAHAFNSMTENLSGQIRKFDVLFKEQEESRILLLKRDEELTKANKMLMDLDKRKSEFISIAAHQLRTPLSGIKWTISTLLEGEMGPLSLEQTAYLKKTYDSNDRIIALVEDMLYADRMESGKNPLVLEAADINAIIDSVMQDLYSKIESKNLKIIFSRNPNIPKIKLDAEKIRAVVQNILENAVKYTPAGGVVSIEVIKSASEVEVRIKDNGIGIPLDQQQNLFTKFFRAQNAVKTVTDGTGLGLFIAKNIIDRHGGRMWCESNEGQGSTFVFTLKI